MNSRKYVPIEEYEYVLARVSQLVLENKELRDRLETREAEIYQLKNNKFSGNLNRLKSEMTWFKPPISPKPSIMKTRSGSAQSRKSFHFLSARSSPSVANLESIEQEIQKAYELRDKTYEELMDQANSPSKNERLKSILERWEIEISLLEEKKNEMASKYSYR